MALKTILAGLFASIWLALSAVLLAAEPRPNVLLIITDDQGYGDLSIHGNPYLSTPNLDQLARSGFQFDRFFVSTFCAPTRAALLTGRYSLRCGVWGVTHTKETMRASEVTLAEALRAAGYRTACFGKWHNGEQFPYTPPGQGFEEFLGFCNGHTNDYFDARLIRGAQPQATEGYIADVITDEAIRFVTSQGEQPFFCHVSYNTPHSPYQVPDKYFDKFRAEGLSPAQAAFYGMCENIDDNVGRLLAALREAGDEENTIVLFLTDNGGTTVVDLFNAGMRGGKTSVHEGGSRVPLFLRWPARYPHPRTIAQVVSHIDIYPTILELCDVRLPSDQPPLDGISLRPLLDDRAVAWPERILFTHNPISQHNRYPGAVRTSRYRLLREIKGPAGGSSAKENDASATPWQLYDMRADPGEEHDLAAEMPDLVSRLSERYERWLDEVRQEGLERLPIQVGHAEENPILLQAHQAQIVGGVHFAAGPGYAHDYLTNWTDPNARVWFEIEVVESGNYEVVVLMACDAEEAGSIIRISAGDSAIEASVLAAEAPFVALPHRDSAGHRELVLRNWVRQPIGQLHLEHGPQQLVLQAARFNRHSLMDLKAVGLMHGE